MCMYYIAAVFKIPIHIITFFEFLFLYISTMIHGIVVVDYYGFLLLAVAKLHEGRTYLDAIVAGGTQCEMTQCDHCWLWGKVSSQCLHTVR